MNDLKSFWNNAHSKDEKLWLTKSDPNYVYKLHNFPYNTSDKTIIEIGIGFGDSVRYLAQKNKIIAIDIAEEALKRVNTIADTYLTENIVNIEDNSVDYALCHLVLQHCNDNMVKFIISNIIRILKDNGVFYFQFADISSKDLDNISDNYKKAISDNILHFRSIDKIRDIVEESKGKMSYISDPLIHTREYNITWYMIQVKKNI